MEDNKISLITILIYLNEDYEGAFTRFYPSDESLVPIALTPKTGMICLFDQSIYHEVPELTNGTKYVIRTEIMYSLS
jgi:hypothetical protein